MKPFTALVLAILLLSGCGRKHETQAITQPDSPAAQVQVQPAESKRRMTTEEVVGTVRAKLHATLEAKLSGRIDKMPVLLGQVVKAGELMARLDAAEIKARLEQAEAGRQQAQGEWKRTSSLFD
jgi:multidrug efflux pump subunit AcrA (membrane-fusion protein)